MNKVFYITKLYITRILLITGLTYAYTHAYPCNADRIEKDSPAFFEDALQTSVANTQEAKDTQAVVINVQK